MLVTHFYIIKYQPSPYAFGRKKTETYVYPLRRLIDSEPHCLTIAASDGQGIIKPCEPALEPLVDSGFLESGRLSAESFNP